MERKKLLVGIDDRRALFGLFFAFGNRLQTAGDAFYQEVTCKQFFLLVCLTLFKEEPPTINQMADVMGSSHQNVKQIVNKLEAGGYVMTCPDGDDKRKLRIKPTDKVESFGIKYYQKEQDFMEKFYMGISDEEVALVLQVMSQIEKNLIDIKENV